MKTVTCGWRFPRKPAWIHGWPQTAWDGRKWWRGCPRPSVPPECRCPARQSAPWLPAPRCGRPGVLRFWRRTGFLRNRPVLRRLQPCQWPGRGFPHLVFHARLFEGAFRFTYGSHLRVAICAAREKAHLPGLIVRIKHALYCLHSFKRSRMRQQHAADHIACRIHAGYGSRIAVIHLDESLFRQLQVQAGRGGNNRLHADGHQADIRRDFLFPVPCCFSRWP